MKGLESERSIFNVWFLSLSTYVFFNAYIWLFYKCLIVIITIVLMLHQSNPVLAQSYTVSSILMILNKVIASQYYNYFLITALPGTVNSI